MTAAVSGPGALSKRTDTGGQPIRELPDPDYGEATAFRESQKGAPLAEAGKSSAPIPAPQPPASGEGGGGEGELPPELAEPLPGMFDPGDPSVPITSGAAIGDGPNEVLGLPAGGGTVQFQPKTMRDAIEPYMAADPSGVLDAVVSALMTKGLW